MDGSDFLAVQEGLVDVVAVSNHATHNVIAGEPNCFFVFECFPLNTTHNHLVSLVTPIIVFVTQAYNCTHNHTSHINYTFHKTLLTSVTIVRRITSNTITRIARLRG